MPVLLLMIFLCLAAAFYLILCGIFHMPTLANTKMVIMLTQSTKARGYQATILRFSNELAKHIHLNPYRRRIMVATLKYAGIDLSPETYYAKSIVKALVCLLPIVFCAFIIPVAIPLFVLLAVKQFMDGTREAQKIVIQKRVKIDQELTRFVETVAQEVEASKDVLSILEGYRNSAGELFRDEIEITISEMKSGSQEEALNHLSGRVGSSMLGQVVQGFLGVIRGGNEVLYFGLLAHDFQSLDYQKLEKEILKRPGEMKPYFWLMLGCFIAIYGYALAYQIMVSGGNLF
jgi:archaeal flagellar protein FlaJ